METAGRTAKSIWAMVQGDPKFMRRVNGWFTIFWIVMIPVSFTLHWLSSVTYVSALSLWALVSGHWSAWQAARVEVEQEREDKEDTEGKMVRRLVEETNITNDEVTKKTTLSKTRKKHKS